ncbi:MAG: transposase, partial [Candidatus Pacearchaeota archaeon]|nr:transposase [Candidatus Pacearchaeota archaeon]
MKIIIQGMLAKERSSRRLASACRENFVFMYLAEKVQPEFSTICRFRRNNKEFVKEAFKETVKLASENDLVDLNLICIDGSKIKANASKKKCIKREQIDQLDSIIDDMIEEDIQEDKNEEKRYQNKEENLTNRDIKDMKEIVKNYKRNKNKFQAKESCEKAKEEFRKEEKLKQVSLTDPECRMMQFKEGLMGLAYNAQFSVDSKNQIILANDICQDRDDSHQLKPQVEEIRKNIKLKEDTKFALDCGYSSGENCRFFEDKKLDGYIPNRTQAQEINGREQSLIYDNYEYDEEKNEIIVKGVRMYYLNTYYHKKDKNYFHVYRSFEDDRICKQVPEFFRERLRMKNKMASEEAKKIYNLRKTIVEPAIGNMKENLRFREFRLRGIEKAKIELNLISLTHNLKKIWVARGKLVINNKNLPFYLIIENNQLNCDTACLPSQLVILNSGTIPVFAQTRMFNFALFFFEFFLPILISKYLLLVLRL